MAALLDVDAVLQRLEDDDFGLSSGEESDYEGEDIQSYLPSAPEDLTGLVTGGGASSSERDGEERPSNDSTPPGPATGPLHGEL